jgi:hypothetical protein
MPYRPGRVRDGRPELKRRRRSSRSPASNFRIFGINDEIDVDGLEKLHERGFNGIWVVVPADAAT